MKLPANLINDVQQGRVVLVLGAGASRGATNSEGQEPPLGSQLSQMLASKFLGGKYSNESLAYVSELAISESSLSIVQNYIRDIFENYKPCNFHLLLPTFCWRSIVTTNYDLIIEDAYSECKESAQNLVRILSNKDQIDELLKTRSDLPFLKIHGCITRTNDPDIPLILTPDQYITHRQGRERLFDMLEGWAYEYPIVFIGHGLQDSDIRNILLKLSKTETFRPRYYLVKPNPNEEEIRLWESKRISVLDGGFKDFLETLNNEIRPETRKIQTLVTNSHPIESRFATTEKMGQDCISFLENEADYVHENLPIENASPSAFYRGFDLGWYPIEKNLDVKRKLADVILFDLILANESDRPTKTEFYIIKAEAGAGKTVFLRRLAWEAAIEGKVLCIYMRKHGRISYDPIYNLYNLVKERIFLFIDNAADNVTKIESIILKARSDKLPLTIISTERQNEWNMSCDRIEPYVTASYTLKYLNRKEIEKLIDLLEKYNSLGHLKRLSLDEKINAFEKRAGRQLLVALHEATLGKPFEDILVDEYNEIRPQLAQSIYLSVCVLNRLNVFVRSGLIARVFGISFDEFKERLFSPLEHVVQVSEGTVALDYYYSARHSQIAEIVFERILKNNNDRFNEYIRMLTALNISYTTDRDAYRMLIKGKNLLELFPEHHAVLEIFKAAHDITQDDPYLFHQQGIYEMNRPNGSLDQAYKYLKQALELDNEDSTIIHSIAELSRLRAGKSNSITEKELCRNDARKLALSLLKDMRSKKYAFHTLIKILLDQLQDILHIDSTVDREIDTIIQKIERYLEQGLQEYPGDPYLLTAEADFSYIMNNEERALNAISKAHEANKRDPFIANRLSKSYIARAEYPKAIKVVKEALEANPSEKRLHFCLAMLLKDKEDSDNNEILYHLNRSFTEWDQNYDAQFWFARYCFVSEDSEKINKSKIIFKRLRELPMQTSVRNEIRSKIEEEGKAVTYSGILNRKEETYGFIDRDGMGDSIFVHINNIGSEAWKELKEGQRVTFNIGFNFGGPIALNVQPKANVLKGIINNQSAVI